MKLYKHFAFISYSRTDSRAAKWLQHRLEWFRFPVKLVPQNSRPPHPKYVRPVYRDKTSLEVDHAHYWENIKTAIDESRFLIILCSPDSARSGPVDLEVRHFLASPDREYPLAGLAPVVLRGHVGTRDGQECLCPALLEQGTAITDRNLPTMAPDDEGSEKDGWENGFIGVTSYLLQVHRESLSDHCQREERKRSRRIRFVAMLFALLAAIAVGMGVFAWVQKQDAVFQRGLADKNAQEAERRRADAEQARKLEATARGQAEEAKTAAVEAERQTRLRASKADADIAVDLAFRGESAKAYAHAVRALDIDPENEIASVVAWRLLTDGCLTLPEFVEAHDSRVTALTFSRDGLHLATGYQDGAVVVKDLVTGKRVVITEETNESIDKLAFSPDGRYLAMGTSVKIGIWDYASHGSETTLKGNFVIVTDDVPGLDVLHLDWPLSDRIVAHCGRDWGSGDATEVYGRTMGKWECLAWFGSTEQGGWVASRRDMLVIKQDDRLKWFDLKGFPNSKEPLRDVELGEGFVEDISREDGIALISGKFSGGGGKQRTLASGDALSDESDVLLYWVDPLSSEIGVIALKALGNSGKISYDGECTRLSGSGKYIFVSTSNGFAIVDRKSGKGLFEHFCKREGEVRLMALRYDGLAWVISSLQKSLRGTVMIGSICNGKNLRIGSLSLPGEVILADFDPTGKWLAIASDDNTVRIWSMARLDQDVLSVRLVNLAERSARSGRCRQGSYELVDEGERAIYRRNAGGGERSLVLKLKDRSFISGFCVSGDDTRLAVSEGMFGGRPDNDFPSDAILYDVASGQAIGAPLRHGGSVCPPRFSPDGRWLFTGSTDCTVRRWSAETGESAGKPIRMGKGIQYIEVSPDGKWIITCWGELIDLGKWTLARQMVPRPGGATAIARALFSPGGQWVATMSELHTFHSYGEPPLVYLALNQWDIESGLQMAQPVELSLGTTGEVSEDWFAENAVSWLEDGREIALGDRAWQCGFPCRAGDLLPFLKACRPLILAQDGTRSLNPDCSLHSLTIEMFFPEGRTAKTMGTYDLVERILWKCKRP